MSANSLTAFAHFVRKKFPNLENYWFFCTSLQMLWHALQTSSGNFHLSGTQSTPSTDSRLSQVGAVGLIWCGPKLGWFISVWFRLKDILVLRRESGIQSRLGYSFQPSLGWFCGSSLCCLLVPEILDLEKYFGVEILKRPEWDSESEWNCFTCSIDWHQVVDSKTVWANMISGRTVFSAWLREYSREPKRNLEYPLIPRTIHTACPTDWLEVWADLRFSQLLDLKILFGVDWSWLLLEIHAKHIRLSCLSMFSRQTSSLGWFSFSPHWAGLNVLAWFGLREYFGV